MSHNGKPKINTNTLMSSFHDDIIIKLMRTPFCRIRSILNLFFCFFLRSLMRFYIQLDFFLLHTQFILYSNYVISELLQYYLGVSFKVTHIFKKKILDNIEEKS